MSNENKNTLKSERYRAKRQARRAVLDFYADDDRQAAVLAWLEQQPSIKEAILTAVEAKMSGKNETI